MFIICCAFILFAFPMLRFSFVPLLLQPLLRAAAAAAADRRPTCDQAEEPIADPPPNTEQPPISHHRCYEQVLSLIHI